jgi:hypothetical protein
VRREPTDTLQRGRRQRIWKMFFGKAAMSGQRKGSNKRDGGDPEHLFFGETLACQSFAVVGSSVAPFVGNLDERFQRRVEAGALLLIKGGVCFLRVDLGVEHVDVDHAANGVFEQILERVRP